VNDLLVPRALLPTKSAQRAMADAGGLWAIPHWSLSNWELMRRNGEFIAEAQRRRVRALEVDTLDEALVEALPDLEFLRVAGIADGQLIERLERLRFLGLATWTGSLDFGRLPALEWLAVGESEAGDLDTLEPGHPTLRNLIVGRYAFADLAPLARLRLVRLSLGDSRRLASLDGAGGLAQTLTGLDLWRLPALGVLDGIARLSGLEVVTLSSLRNVTTLHWASALPNLRLLDIRELKNVESLAPLAGHPSLEYVLFGRTRDMDLEPLRQIPNLRICSSPPGRWRGDGEDIPELSRRAHDGADVVAMWRLREG